MARDISETKFMVYPPKKRRINEIMREKGIIREMITAGLMLRRNPKVTKTTKNIPQNKVFLRFFIAVRIFSELSITIFILTSEGRVF
jgi:hypothetical protein